LWDNRKTIDPRRMDGHFVLACGDLFASNLLDGRNMGGANAP
jgi:hypothetical protein